MEFIRSGRFITITLVSGLGFSIRIKLIGSFLCEAGAISSVGNLTRGNVRVSREWDAQRRQVAAYRVRSGEFPVLERRGQALTECSEVKDLENLAPVPIQRRAPRKTTSNRDGDVRSRPEGLSSRCTWDLWVTLSTSGFDSRVSPNLI